MLGFVFIRMRIWSPEIPGICVPDSKAVHANRKRVSEENRNATCCSVKIDELRVDSMKDHITVIFGITVSVIFKIILFYSQKPYTKLY